jgi:hypothetical protein
MLPDWDGPVKSRFLPCYSSVNLSPINFSVKMSPYERKGDIEHQRIGMVTGDERGNRWKDDRATSCQNAFDRATAKAMTIGQVPASRRRGDCPGQLQKSTGKYNGPVRGGRNPPPIFVRKWAILRPVPALI